MSLTLTPSQQAAVDAFADFIIDPLASELMLTGGAGYGKSTLTQELLTRLGPLQSMLQVIMNTAQVPVFVTATTNQAAKVIADMIGQEPKTIYSLLGLLVKNDHKTGKTYLSPGREYKVLEKAVIFIDEAGFLNHDALKWVRKSLTKCKVIYILDKDQLLAPKETLCPVHESTHNIVELQEPVRNSGAIWELGEQFRRTVNTGVFEPIIPNGKDVLWVDGPTFQAMVDEDFKDINRNEFSSKILNWSNTMVRQYNEYVRQQLHGRGAALEVGERVMSNKAILGKMPTDARAVITGVGAPSVCHNIPGRKISLDNGATLFTPDDQEQVDRYMKALSKAREWGTYFEIKENWGDLRPLHSCTVHKSQGSTYDRVYLNLNDIGRCNIASDVARMLYVGASRARHQVVLYGELPEKYQGQPLAKVDAWA